MKISTQVSLYIILVLLVVICVLYDENKRESEVVHTHTTDTITIVKNDTVIETRVKYLEKRIVDTVFVETKSGEIITLPIVSKHFGKEETYDVWVSGVEPLEMDSIMVYPRTEYRTITNTERTTIDKKGTDIYVNAGLSHADGSFMPRVGISIKTNKNVLYGAEIGSFDGKTFLGVNVGFKINK